MPSLLGARSLGSYILSASSEIPVEIRAEFAAPTVHIGTWFRSKEAKEKTKRSKWPIILSIMLLDEDVIGKAMTCLIQSAAGVELTRDEAQSDTGKTWGNSHPISKIAGESRKFS